MRFAHVVGNVIWNVIDTTPPDAAARGLVNIDSIVPVPGVGWTFTGGVWTAPVLDQAEVNLEALQARAQAALAANATFQAIGAPTNAQTLAQVQLLTKECNGIIRLALGLLDSTAGT